ncbi:bifunctional ADP-dependent NAD(P)H-hydrate dehydratase/NAD(P)H-hydrate epimerase [Tropicimonas marinistellae]|uniref:bifunctional ADP-dependent NAD(P)H-hydrate dehydratase/NAD(P)H-hydrate epimerase n=1 Tax=Tropicimonas marinistellae TaxID=1739787 RepID=UPI00082B31B6|nr:bifunctional ADP-dependent NAD(P)H-hydrate dehydratase/NAD(P)H-hydrate epimerase [Tropicimonas marinistellae]
MTELLTSAQMRAIEQAAFDLGAATGSELMERAGQGVVDAMFAAFPDLEEGHRHAVILCGPGNNGGDGFVIARLLQERGWQVECFLYGDAIRLPPDAKANHDRWADMGQVVPFADWRFGLRYGVRMASEKAPSVLIDALFGTGLTRPMEEDLDQALRELDAAFPKGTARRVAVDAPSGLCMDSGRPLMLGSREELPLRFDLAVSFHRRKLGHLLAEGPDCCGSVAVADIGLDQGALRTARPELREVLGAAVTAAIPRAYELRKGSDDTAASHKYDYGHALILSGGPGHTGAARLAARGALRVGAGLVTVAAPGTAVSECAAHLTAIMLTRCNGASDLGGLLEDDRKNALCLGPGLGIGAATRDMVMTALGSRRRCVLDADALTSFEGSPPTLFAHLHSRVVLTPHAGEFARLFPDIWRKLSEAPQGGPAYSKVEATQEAAARAGCIVLFKGRDTVIAEPGGRTVLNAAAYERSAPWLATAGAGDVLAGMITGLLARDIWPVTAAEIAVWLHVEAARRFGPGVIATDLPDQLPGVFRELGL